MLKAKVFSAKGIKMEDLSLSKEYGKDVNLNFLAQVARVYEAKGHIGLRKTKTRAEVVKSTRKIYKQKGTGGARHGAKSAPIFVGGGIAHGPRPEKRLLDLPLKVRRSAKLSAIAYKVSGSQGFVVDGIAKIAKTGEASQIIKKLAKEGLGGKIAVILASGGVAVKAFRNLANVSVFTFGNVNAGDILKSRAIVLDKNIFSGSGKKVEKEVKEVKKAVKAKKETK